MGRRRERTCEICRRPIEAGDDVRRVRLLAEGRTYAVHARCFREDWERIEEGLEAYDEQVRSPRR